MPVRGAREGACGSVVQAGGTGSRTHHYGKGKARHMGWMTKQTKRRAIIALIVGLIIGALYVIGQGYESGNGAWAFAT